MRTLRLILGDQLNGAHSWYQEKSETTWYCFFEMRQETDYVQHHIQKVIAFFASMRTFASELRAEGHQVIYFELDHPENTQNLVQNLSLLIAKHKIQHFDYQLPDEYRLDQQLHIFSTNLEISSKAWDTEHFLSSRDELATFFKGKKQYLMESFYRNIRRKFNILMDGKEPLTGKWNYDAENRKKMPAKHVPPAPKLFPKQVEAIQQLLDKENIKTIGSVDSKAFIWPTSRAESLALLDHFVQQHLQYFGTFQDAMTPDYWSLYHSRLSFSINTKMLSPLEVVKQTIAYWEQHQDLISIAQIEGFVRQIIGWREYMRGVYWAHMPGYGTLNYFEHDRKLPDWYWTGATKMHCLSHAIKQSLHYAYAHHIQRLMVTGNFALLAGIHPDEIDAWYLGIYIDAIEWVEITNTRGMSQFADGGIVGTKPYVSSANYIHKMGHYCKNCYYDRKAKTGPKACPFNSLYWHFYDRNRAMLGKNPRIGMMYRIWDKMEGEQQEEILKTAEDYLSNLNSL